jgi:membrane protease YdiL (CAAX protease family)
LTPLILLGYWVILQFLQAQPHLLERLGKIQLLDVEQVLIVFLAVIAAPVMEELLFRGVLLPWQLSNPIAAQFTVGMTALPVSVLFAFDKNGNFQVGPVLFVLAMLPGYLLIPYVHQRLLSRKRRWAAEGGSGDDRERAPIAATYSVRWRKRLYQMLGISAPRASQRRINVLLALYSNALLFATIHANAWPSPIPLVPLSVGLAWLAYRTRTLVGPIVTHALFNGVATLTILQG